MVLISKGSIVIGAMCLNAQSLPTKGGIHFKGTSPSRPTVFYHVPISLLCPRSTECYKFSYLVTKYGKWVLL
ncbi:hypothetical protein XELAEV_18009065mg [Xenopus laevis]|uniref:Uncharacterized protein n=1 Tax=Xenopus laevis TaxID=8355 RepID=A0A974DRP8_XENLA|nr:hypothetical protein XELAEV_18009065mg [Xenopus laevis]